jgi:hypothetical protein
MAVTSPVQFTKDFEKDFSSIIKYVSGYKESQNKDFFNKPYFKTYFKSKNISEVVPFFEIVNFINNYLVLSKVWEDVDINHYQTYHRIMELFSFRYMDNEASREWLTKEISSKTFFNMIVQAYKKTSYSQTDQYFRDTFSQLQKLYKKNATITRPKRWRLLDFHDHVSFLFLESTIDNKDHDNEFLPSPVTTNDGWNIRQPKDTLELALWGKKVHNCVLSYEDAIEKKQSAIILIEQNEAPKFTVELDYEKLKKKKIHIKQVVGMSNSSLSSEERNQCDSILTNILIKA